MAECSDGDCLTPQEQQQQQQQQYQHQQRQLQQYQGYGQIPQRVTQDGLNPLGLYDVIQAASQQQPEPSYLQSNSEVTIYSDESRCVRTDDLEEAVEILQDKGRVVLCGPPGSGKTTVGRAILRHFREEGFIPYSLSKMEEWNAHIGEGKKSVVLIDGLLGEVRVNTQQYDDWKSIVDTALELTDQGNCRLVLTLYPHVLRELQRMGSGRRSHWMDRAVVLHLMRKSLDRDVKIKLLDFHLKNFHLGQDTQRHLVERMLQKDISGPVFLWCCRHVVDHWQLSDDHTAIFTVPAEAYASLLTPMMLHVKHGDIFAAVLSFAMLGLGRFLRQPQKVQSDLKRLGLSDYCDDRLANYADLLYGSILSDKDGRFPSRVLYDAVGLSLGRSFRLSTLLRACDIKFLVQHVRTPIPTTYLSVNRKKELCFSVGSMSCCSEAQPNKTTSEDCQSLMERVHAEITQGNLPAICQHPSLQLPEFLHRLEEFYKREKNAVQRLVSAVDPEHKLPLVYWSVFNQSHNLTHWCLKVMTETQSGLELLTPQVLLACLLFPQWANSTEGTTLLPLIRDVLTPNRLRLSVDVVTLPLLKKDDCLTESHQHFYDVICSPDSSRRQMHYLCDPPLPIPPDVVSVQVLDDTARVQVRDRGQWYLVLKLLTDSQVDEADQDGNTMLHLAANTGHLEAIRLAVKSGASLLVKNNKGLTPYKLAQERRKREKDRKAEDGGSYFYSAACFGDEVTVKTLLCYSVSVHHENNHGNTCLFAACKEGHEGIAELLIKLGADVNTQAYRGFDDSLFLLLFSPLTALHLACYYGLTHTVELLIQHGADVNMKTKCGQSALHFACQCDSPTASADIIRLLVDSGADVNVQKKNGITLLGEACRNGNKDKADLLIRLGADVNVQDKYGITLLSEACRKGDKDMTDLLIRHGADVNFQDEHGCTPLHEACSKGKRDLSDLLICHGAKVNVQNKRGHTPLRVACRKGNRDIADLLIRHGADVSVQDGNTLLFEACRHGNRDLSDLLIRRGADVNAQHKYGNTPLHEACSKGNKDLCDLLIRHGAKVSVQNNDGNTPLHEACSLGKENGDLCDMLIHHGANVDGQGKNGNTPLHVACRQGNRDLFDLLIRHGAKVNVQNNGGNTPLLVACSERNRDLSELLIHHGANVNVQNNDGNTPLHEAYEDGMSYLLIHHGADINTKNKNNHTPLYTAYLYHNPDIVSLLIQAGAELSRVHQTAACGQVDDLMTLIHQGADVNHHANRMGCSPLHAAAMMGQTDTVTCLVRHGANVDAVDCAGDTPLHCACRHGHTQIALYLIELGADVKARTEWKSTPLHFACEKGDTEMAVCLLQYGADVNARDQRDNTPLDCACKAGHAQIVPCLIEHGAEVNTTVCGFLLNSTPLELACEHGHTQTALCLIQHGANVNSKTKLGHTALDAARENHHDDIVHLLKQHGAVSGELAD